MNQLKIKKRSTQPYIERLSLLGIILLSSLITLSLCGMMIRSGVSGISIQSFLEIESGWVIIILSGIISSDIFGRGKTSENYCLFISSGIVLSCISVLIIALLLHVSSLLAFEIWTCIVVIGLCLRRASFSIWLSKKSYEALIAVFLSIIIVTLWCWNPLNSVAHMKEAGLISLWTDCFIHATTILSFGDFNSLHQGSFEFIDDIRRLYHYGSYILPAAMLPLADMSGLQAEAALLVPIGLIALLTGTYALTRELLNGTSYKHYCFVVIFLLGIIPDPSVYGMANGWFGLRWMLLSSPGSGYAIAGVLISLIYAKNWIETRSTGSLIGALIFALMVFQLRVHMLMWYGPALVLWLATNENHDVIKWVKNRKKGMLGIGLTILMLALPLATIKEYLHYVHLGVEPTGYTGIYAHLVSVLGENLSAIIGFILLFPGMLGILLFLYPICLYISKNRNLVCFFPLYLVATAAIIIVFVPPSQSGDPFEYKHRAFVLLYVVILIWTTVLALPYLSRLLGEKILFRVEKLFLVIITVITCLNLNSFLNLDKPKFLCGKQYVDTPISKDLINSAEFMRHHSCSSDVAVIYPIDIQARAAEDATRFSAISNVPLYLSRYTLFNPLIANKRLETITKIAKSKNYSEFVELMKENGFTYFVLNTKEPPDFDKLGCKSTFQSGNWMIYRP
jgi:hypothetical protein